MTLHANVQATAEIHQRDGDPITLYPTEINYNTSRYHEAALMEVTAVSTAPLDDVRGVELGQVEGSIDPDSDAEVEKPPLVPNSTAILFINNFLVGGGRMEDLSVGENGLVTLTATDGVRNLIQSNFTHSFSEGVPIQTAVRTAIENAGITPTAGTELGRGERADEETDLIPGESAYDVSVTDDIDESLEEQPQAGMAPFITDREFTNVTALEALDTLVSDAGWYWYCDRTNTVRVEPTFPSIEYQLEYILETTAGLQSPPYQRVIVTGGAQRTPGGMEETGPVPNNTMTRDPVQAEAGEGEPVYAYTDKSIRSEQNAQNVADGILEEFETQRKSGEITIVGNPNIRPFDTVIMPESMGGEEYLVSSIEHAVNGTDGFQTTIGVGGVTDTGV